MFPLAVEISKIYKFCPSKLYGGKKGYMEFFPFYVTGLKNYIKELENQITGLENCLGLVSLRTRCKNPIRQGFSLEL